MVNAKYKITNKFRFSDCFIISVRDFDKNLNVAQFKLFNRDQWNIYKNILMRDRLIKKTGKSIDEIAFETKADLSDLLSRNYTTNEISLRIYNV